MYIDGAQRKSIKVRRIRPAGVTDTTTTVPHCPVGDSPSHQAPPKISTNCYQAPPAIVDTEESTGTHWHAQPLLAVAAAIDDSRYVAAFLLLLTTLEESTTRKGISSRRRISIFTKYSFLMSPLILKAEIENWMGHMYLLDKPQITAPEQCYKSDFCEFSSSSS